MEMLDGQLVVMSRAPMTTPSVMRVRVIQDDHPMAEMIEADTAYISPIGNVKDAGDCDGDGRTFTLAADSNLPVTTFDEVVNNVIERTGSDQLVPGGSYWGDHYNVPSVKAVAKKRGLSAKNLSLANDPNKRKSLPGMLEGSTEMFQEAVGWVHRLFLTTDIYLSTLWELETDLKELFPKWSPARFTANRSLILILAEIYEVPLGGLSWEAYDVIFGMLIPLLQGTLKAKFVTPDNIAQFETELNEAGMNGNAAKDIIDAALTVASCRYMSKEGTPSSVLDDPDEFLQLVAELATLISKGQLELSNEKHLLLIETYFAWQQSYDPGLALVNKSVTLMQVHELLTTVAVAYQGEIPEVDLDYFV